MHLDVHPLIHQYGYTAVFAILFLEVVGIPFPAETTLVIAGLSMTAGHLRFLPLVLAAAAGNLGGSMLAFLVGYYLGRPVVLHWGRYVWITGERLDRANEYFQHYGNWIVSLSKYIAGVRVIVPYLAGINRMDGVQFSLFSALGSVLWAASFLLLGRYARQTWARLQFLLTPLALAMVVVVVVILAGGAYWVTHRRSPHT